MKKLHKYKLDNEHHVIVYDNNSKSNYNRFITVVLGSTILWGTTLKPSDKNEYIKEGQRGLNLYKNQRIL